MADRIDVLGRNDARLAAFTGALLDGDEDDTLQELVERAADELRAPMALVSLVLAHTQYFRAHVGLPEELAMARATDRDLSFCQFVVRDGTSFEVNDASRDPRVPQGLVGRYDLGAYLGMPITANGEVVGSLCVLDTNAREFTAIERSALLELSRQVSERLSVLARSAGLGPSALAVKAIAPAFAELRNLLMPLTIGVNLARVIATELAPIARVADPALTDEQRGKALASLIRPVQALGELHRIHDDIARVGEAISQQILAIERASMNISDTGDADVICRAATELAHHSTKLVGGARYEVQGTVAVATNTATAIRVIAAALDAVATIARRKLVQSGIDMAVAEQGGRVVATIAVNNVDLAGAVAELLPIVAGEAAVKVAATDQRLTLSFWPR